MHKILLNRVSLTVGLTPRTPFLVKAGREGATLLEADRPDLAALRSGYGEDATVFIPGSTLKGVVRSATERQLRSYAPDARSVDAWACDPHAEAGACRPTKERNADTAAEHKRQCLACRIFGSTSVGSRVHFADALPTSATRERANRTETRSNVAIDRKTGGPAPHKLFEMELVTGGTFEVRVVLENVQVWQVGLLATVLEDLDAGFVRIGSARSRGLGSFALDYTRLEWRQPAHRDRPAGVGLLRPDLRPAYGWLDEPELPAAPTGSGRWTWEGVAARTWLEAVAAVGVAPLEHWGGRT